MNTTLQETYHLPPHAGTPPPHTRQVLQSDMLWDLGWTSQGSVYEDG